MTQGLLQLATTGTVSGLQNNQAANTALAALAGMIQGGSAPTPLSTGLVSTAGVWWHDTTNSQIKLRDQADANWLPMASLDETNKALMVLLRSYLAGLTLSNDGASPNTVIDVSAGVCADDTNVAMLNLPAGQTINCAATGAGGLDSGSLAASTWYHAFVIGKSGGGAGALLASTSLASPAFPTGYTLKRRIGSFKTDASAHILGFSQNGDEFLWNVSINDVNNATVTATASLLTLSVPPAIKVNALFRAFAVAGGGVLIFTSPDENDQAASFPGAGQDLATSSAVGEAARFTVRTNANQQIRGRAALANVQLYISTYGWLDLRGRFI